MEREGGSVDVKEEGGFEVQVFVNCMKDSWAFDLNSIIEVEGNRGEGAAFVEGHSICIGGWGEVESIADNLKE